MADLHLDSLEIKNFRTFKHLTIERLGRVNLVVGKNGVGKTALLEALWVYVNYNWPSVLLDVVEERDEISLEMSRSELDMSRGMKYLALRHLFYGRPDLFYEDASLSIGPVQNSDKTVHIKFGSPPDEKRRGPIGNPHLNVTVGDKEHCWELHEQGIEGYQRRDERDPYIRNKWVPAGGMSDQKIAKLWDEVHLTQGEELATQALNLVKTTTEKVERVGFIQAVPHRIALAKVQGSPFRVPLRSLGEGMTRLLGMALALVNASGGLLLIDEVESGLHYSVQPDMWRLIFETAKRLNVQVFATTHSLDCLRAFEQAASEHGEEDSMLVSLRRHQEDPEKIVAVLAGKERLESIVRSHIEVR